MTGTVLQINVSRGGLPKRAIAEGELTRGGFVGDSWAHPKIHGGPQQAVLLIANELIERLRANGYPVYPGALGENLTTSGLDPELWRAGQLYRVGEAEIELTKLRQPCNQLNVYGPPIQREIPGALAGYYARVVRPGWVFPGNPIVLVAEVG